jgi:hypothetical protein
MNLQQDDDLSRSGHGDQNDKEKGCSFHHFLPILAIVLSHRYLENQPKPVIPAKAGI